MSYEQTSGQAKTDKLMVEFLSKRRGQIIVKDVIYRKNKTTHATVHQKHSDETGHELCHILRHVNTMERLEVDIRDYLFASFDARMQALLSGKNTTWRA